MHIWDQNMHKEWPEWELMRTWATNEQCAIIKMESVYNKEHKTYYMRHQIEIKKLLRENCIFEIYLKFGVLEIIWKLDF